ncbi:hypothetical protein AWC38_SpisGene1942 [Stylophora pistillata]|uniref:SEA domain-containing protein n=1 Tax=Stylophora pistillata TaxID=50429 RepID=A0A2B4SV59_STYPI|nr:hypothetical protein AWC38_SpisGene1942 [Stylophora pistillata]
MCVEAKGTEDIRDIIEDSLIQQDPAGVTTASLNQTVQLRKNVPLHRWADGNPAPTITWVQKNSVGRGNKLHFDLPNFTDAGWFTYDRGTGIGERAYLDIAESESRLFSGEMVILNEKLDIGLLNKESEKYQNFSKRIAQVVEDLFKADINYYATKVIQFESGCAKVYFTLKFKKIVRASIIISALKYAAVDEKFGSFVVDPLSIKASQDKIPASSSQASQGEDLSSIFIVCLVTGLIALLWFMCCSDTHETPSETGKPKSSSTPTYRGDGSTVDKRPPQDFYKSWKNKPDGTYEEEYVLRKGNTEHYDKMTKKADGTKERRKGVRGDDVTSYLDGKIEQLLALE